MIRIGREIQCLPYAGFFSSNWLAVGRQLQLPGGDLSPVFEPHLANGEASELRGWGYAWVCPGAISVASMSPNPKAGASLALAWG